MDIIKNYFFYQRSQMTIHHEMKTDNFVVDNICVVVFLCLWCSFLKCFNVQSDSPFHLECLALFLFNLLLVISVDACESRSQELS